MSRQLYQSIETLDHNELEVQLALQCAPLLTGIKLSNLLIVNKSDRDTVIKLFRKTALSYYIMYASEEKTTFFLYHKVKLLQYLQASAAREILKLSGYQKYEPESILRELSKRYSHYIRYRGVFPHEIGLFLGYPVEDVAGFIKNQGKNALYTGYWKVYHNLPDAMVLFDKYRQAKELVIQMISQGVSVQHILESYY